MHTNRLINEKSPYLLQHAHNPVDWHPWSEETFVCARKEDKPIFLSIGYAACHWCHVMEKESFEDAEVARHLNDTFVCIKVDREERPDIDMVYMAACQMLTGSGGWPLNIFMTPDKTPFFADTVRDIFTYVLRDMTAGSGAFFAAEDADSEGEEGKFYVWSLEEFQRLLSEEAAPFERLLNLSAEGNFFDEATQRKTGMNILHLDQSLDGWSKETGVGKEEIDRQWEKVRQKLFDHRKQRVHPLKDDKILTSWNGLMIAALALGSRALNEPAYAEAAERTARFILNTLRDSDGRLFHRYREEEIAVEAHADDYAYLILGLLELYATGFDPYYLEEAVCLQEKMLADFWDASSGGFYFTAKHAAKELPVRPKELYDGALPSANSVSLLNLLRLLRLTGDPIWENKASELTRAFAGTVRKQPTAFTCFLVGVDFRTDSRQSAHRPQSDDRRG